MKKMDAAATELEAMCACADAAQGYPVENEESALPKPK